MTDRLSRRHFNATVAAGGAYGAFHQLLGMAAALPHVDEFVAGHSVAAFEEVLRVIGDA